MIESYWQIVWKQFKKSKIGLAALIVLAFFFLVGLYAPFFASGKPLVVLWKGSFYFPLFRYLFYKGYYTKPIDLFFNLLMFTLPIALMGVWLLKKNMRKKWILGLATGHILLFSWIALGAIKDPACDSASQCLRNRAMQEQYHYFEDPLLAPLPAQINWNFESQFLNDYAQLNQLIAYKQILAQHERLSSYSSAYEQKKGRPMPTLLHVWQRNEETALQRLRLKIKEDEKHYASAHKQLPHLMAGYRPYSHAFIMAKYRLKHELTEDEKKTKKTLDDLTNEAIAFKAPLAQARQIILSHQRALAELDFFEEKRKWLYSESKKVQILIPPLVRFFHWEEDAGGAQEANQFLPWWELTRINRKDLVASLLFGIRVSTVVGFSAVALALLIGVPLGMVAGYFAGKIDLFVCRVVEMWEAMPTFFMLLLVVAILQTKSVFLVIFVLGIFGWTGIARFMRSEVLKQRKLSYVLSCQSIGFTPLRIMYSHILPNAIPPILTLIPFSIMAAITSEAALSFLGLGEEGSASWGVLMDEGRSAFPAESYLLWPPAILLTLLLICIALVGDHLRDAIDPKMR